MPFRKMSHLKSKRGHLSTKRMLGLGVLLSSIAVGSVLVFSRWSATPSTFLGAASENQSARQDVRFLGSCDASGAVPLSEHTFVLADDEDNVLRVYDADRGGFPLHTIDVSEKVGIEPKLRKKGKPRPSREADLEAATGVGSLAFWISSHGRKKSGKVQPERFRFFATTHPSYGRSTELVGRVREDLLDHLLEDPRMTPFDLKHAMQQPAGSPHGLNVEGMTAREEGGVFIGLRSPTPDKLALILTLDNPEGVVRGENPQFGPPRTLNLGGLGVRGLSSWRGRYLIIAGGHAGQHESRLYSWSGNDSAPTLLPPRFRDFNPEAFFTPETRDTILLLSDDGERLHDGKRCKDLDDSNEKSFRGRWYQLPQPSLSSKVETAG